MKKRLNKLILIVDDEKDIRNLVSFNLKKAGFQTLLASDGEKAIRETRTHYPDLIVLDLMLPGINGHDACRVLKGDPKTSKIPILMLTARGEEADIIKGLEIGADDYVTKPFSPKVLVARVKALLRREEEIDLGSDGKLVYGSLEIHTGKREVRTNGDLVDLTFSEFQILFLLASHPNWVFTRNQIIEEIRGENYFVTDRAVDFQIVGLRKKLGRDGQLIKTVRGVGYRFYFEK
ncbi:MAG: response regulator transcription factor [FCB group bacterium]|nr:response regulator transcription factor [FCB group bacterium]